MTDILTKRFLLIDDHEIVRSGVNMVLSLLYKPVEIFEATDGDSATILLKKHCFNLVLLDIQMPNTDSFGLLEYITIKFPETKVLIFSMNAENVFAKRFLKAGAKGFVSKDAPLDELTKAIDLALHNKRYISAKLQNQLADELASIENIVNPFDKLLPKEFEITSLFISGENVTGISKILNVNTSTIGHYKNKIFEKLGIASVLELQALYNSYHKTE